MIIKFLKNSLHVRHYHLTLNNFYNSSNDEQIQMIKLILGIVPLKIGRLINDINQNENYI